ncbi:thiamine pyrophosphate enzyme [Biscogniauxia mediterranea]|nr:thiamine pyrophosphate enzyme [Biscogniauxia mediterranea]
MKLAEYLFSRIRQLGVDSVHGVPGDFNLTLLDYVEPAGLLWVGNANELNAAYAADGYARIKGLGAIVTTFGVGELSALNAIAGAFAERAPVVHIVGVPPRPSQDSRLLIHHTFNDGEYKRFAQIAAQVTVAQTRLWDPRTSPQQIDDVLRQCLQHSRPVYIEVPVDLVAAPVADDGLKIPIKILDFVPGPAQEAVLSRIIDRIHQAKQPILLVDGETRALGIINEVQKLSEMTNWPTWCTSFGKGLLDETRPNFHGIYRGNYDDPAVQAFVKEADLVLCCGPHHSSTNSFAFSSITNPETTILITDTEVKFGNDICRDVPAKYIASQLIQKLEASNINKYESYPSLPRDSLLPLSEASGDGPITQDRMWRILANILRPGDIVLGETGTAGYGVREMPLPKHTRLFTPVTWLSIGYMLPAAQGAALAQRELAKSSAYYGIQDARTILFIGDGSLQMTVQELATIIRHDLNVIVFVINNDGYTIERCIHGRKQGYNDVSRWRYLQAPSFFGASEDTYTASARTWAELASILGQDRLLNGKGLRMVEVMVGREDAPRGILMRILEAQKEREGSSA